MLGLYSSSMGYTVLASNEQERYFSKCDIYLSLQSLPGRELILQHNIIERPWAKIGL